MSTVQKPERVWNDPPMPGESKRNLLKGIPFDWRITVLLLIYNIGTGIWDCIQNPSTINHLTAFNGMIDITMNPTSVIMICLIIWIIGSILFTPIIVWELQLFYRLCGGGK